MSIEKSPIEFLPSGPHSWDDLSKAVLENLDATIDLIEPLPTAEISLESLEKVEPGIYLIPKRPTIDLLRQLPKFKDGTAEVGIFCVNGKWIVSISEGLHASLPHTLEAIEHSHVFQADMHSHPGDDPGSRQPSDSDIYRLDSTVDGKNYIISNTGLIEFELTGNLPGGYTSQRDVHKAWTHWIRVDLKITEDDEFNQRGGWDLKEEFYRKFFNMKIIPWQDIEKIENILLSKEQLRIRK